MAEPPARTGLAARFGALTQARIGLGRVGQSLTTPDMLDFQLAHARARDAVHTALDVGALRAAMPGRDMIEVRSQAGDRAIYLQRPDLGRLLDEADAAKLKPVKDQLAIIIGDGLSANAVARHAPPLVEALLDRLAGWSDAPVICAHQARVALGDAIGAALRVDLVVMLIGERPGLSAPDSLGAYITWAPQPGRRDSERNCVSNIRPPHGLGYAAAAEQIAGLASQARRLGLTGVGLKPEGLGGLIAPS
ncbi:ethanolamine ammonia-lyase subunit EutC [soil metagenome]